ncbi:putative methyltransferase PMT15 [Prunus yedoensis var. nudiflora]|uniref:Methyltransferase n=1 Tax=Prunus yedoensis var. nudiflora TaxID=2094558 RepID=A0A314UGX0_PRUYE|nr:putative methyltransferase PMT15 [Prunus yedoensis var. nudiflora]
MASPSPLHHFSLKPKRANLYYMTLVAVLCTLCYLVGIWQHSTGTTAITAAISTSDSSCPPIPRNTTIHLDFEAHHRAEDLPLPPAARVPHLPPCDAKLSEYTPCQDVTRSLKFDRERLVYRERHCPEKEELLKCRIPAPHGYTVPFGWPESRDSVWYANVPHKELTVEKKKQNWVHYEGDRFRFPGGGTMFPRGADAYIDEIGKLINLRDGSVRTAIDTGCGFVDWWFGCGCHVELVIVDVMFWVYSHQYS